MAMASGAADSPKGAVVSPALSGAAAVASVGSVLLAGRLAWEQTVWSWENGPQMVGFSLAHGPGMVLLLCPVLLAVTLVLLLVVTARDLARRRRVPWRRWGGMGLASVCLSLANISYGFWQRLFVDRIATGPFAAEFLIHDSALGDSRTVKALVAHGVPVTARSRRTHQTALHAAAVEGKTDVIEYLLSEGADVNAVDRYGNSPLQNAMEMGRSEAVRVLTLRGAQRVTGGPELLDRVSKEIIEEDAARMSRKDLR